MSGQGKPLGPDRKATIRKLLATTDLDISAIAKRIGASRSTITAVNNEFKVREYHGHHSIWQLNSK